MCKIWSISSIKSTLFIATLILHFFYNPTDSGAVQLTQNNLDMTLASNELVFINFYADWCRFSNLLQPIFDEAADKVSALFPEAGRVVMGKVDCDKESSVSSRFHITKYPTLKIIRNGEPMKKEYRGQRSADAFTEFIKEQLKDTIREFTSVDDLNQSVQDKRILIGYFDKRDMPEYEIFRKVAVSLKEECEFHVGFGDTVKAMHPVGHPLIVFRADKSRSNDQDEAFTGNQLSFDEVRAWAQDKCVPLVREITFANAEELTEEGLPFLILFFSPEDTESIKKYNDIVTNELQTERQNINFLVADGKKFEHPLHHLGKSSKDLPLIAIDSFRHMYLFPDFKDIDKPGKLKQFIQDLYSGKLHREFHYGPDEQTENNQNGDNSAEKNTTTPPESTFKKLGPSKNRYTLLRDEL